MKRKHSLKGLLFMFFAMLLVFPVNVKAATTNKCYVLKRNQNYYYDLDKNGKKEKILWNVTGSNENYKFVLKINGKTAQVKSSRFNFFWVVITDANPKDSQMELIIMEAPFTGYNDESRDNFSQWESLDMKSARYYKYIGGKTVFQQELSSVFRANIKAADIHAVHSYNNKTAFRVKGDGKIEAILCLDPTRTFMQNFSFCQNVVTSIKLVNGKFVPVKKAEYSSQWQDTQFYQQFDDFSDMITASKDFKVFTTPGGKKVSFTVKKGDTLPYVIGVYRKTNWKLYMKVRTQNGKIGYVDPLGETRNEKWWGGIRFFWHYM